MVKHDSSLNVRFSHQYKQNVHWERVQALPRLPNSQLAIKCQHRPYSENCTYKKREGLKAGLHRNDSEGTPGGAKAKENKILHMILMFDPLSPSCVSF